MSAHLPFLFFLFHHCSGYCTELQECFTMNPLLIKFIFAQKVSKALYVEHLMNI